jgi:hypothetical protein
MIYNVYLVCAEFNGDKLYKIGYTRRPIEKRVKELKTGNAADFYIVDSFSSKWGTKIESVLHRTYRSKKVNREWFDLSEKDVNNFKKECEKMHNNFEIIYKNNTYYIEKGDF